MNEFGFVADNEINDNFGFVADDEEVSTQPVEQATPVLTGGIEQKVIPNWDKKGRIYYTDEQGNRIKSNVPLSRKIGNKLRATGYNVKDWLTTDVGEKAKERRKAVAMLVSAPLGIGRGITGMALSGGLGSGVYSGSEQAIEGEFKPKQLLADIGIGAALGGALGLGGKYIAKPIINKIAKSKVTKAKPQVNQEVIEQPIQQVDEVVESVPQQTEQSKANLNTLKSNIRANKFEQGNLKDYMVVDKGKKGYKSTIADPISYDVENSQRDFNKIITEISKNPEKLNEAGYLDELENRVQQIIDRTPYGETEEVAMPYWEKLWKAVDDGNNYNEFKLNSGKKPQQHDEVIPKQVVEDTAKTKERGFVDTIRQNYGDEVAKQIGDKEYDVYSHEMQKANWESRTP